MRIEIKTKERSETNELQIQWSCAYALNVLEDSSSDMPRIQVPLRPPKMKFPDFSQADEGGE
jgi:hypothetical protein